MWVPPGLAKPPARAPARAPVGARHADAVRVQAEPCIRGRIGVGSLDIVVTRL
jgi:hypothetical protein